MSENGPNMDTFWSNRKNVQMSENCPNMYTFCRNRENVQMSENDQICIHFAVTEKMSKCPRIAQICMYIFCNNRKNVQMSENGLNMYTFLSTFSSSSFEPKVWKWLNETMWQGFWALSFSTENCTSLLIHALMPFQIRLRVHCDWDIKSKDHFCPSIWSILCCPPSPPPPRFRSQTDRIFFERMLPSLKGRSVLKC